MKPWSAIVVFVVLLFSSAVSEFCNYKTAERSIVCDLSQALDKTLKERTEGWITPDTIRIYRSHLRISALKSRASLSYCQRREPCDMICSDTMIWRTERRNVHCKGYANCSMATVLGLSNQRLPLGLSFLAMLWGVFWMLYFRHYTSETIEGSLQLGTLHYVENSHCFYDSHCKPLHLTPMQQQLMELFVQKDNLQLGKKEICDALWPKKEDASETLHTLIRRLKRVIESRSNIRICCQRGRFYQLKIMH